MNSPTVKIKIEADTNSARQNIKNVESDTKKLNQTTKTTTNTFQKTDKQLNQTNSNLKNLSQATNLSNSSVKNLGGGFSSMLPILGKLTGIIGGVGGAIALVKKSFDSLKNSMNAFTEINSAIIRGTGAIGDKLKNLNLVAENVGRKSIFGFNEVGKLVAGIETLFNLSPEKNQKLAEWISQLATITSMSTNDILDSINQIHNATGTQIDLTLFNKLAATSQNVNKYYQQILQTLGEYSATLKTIGVDNFDKQLLFLTNIAKKGFDPSQIVAQFGILSKKIIETSQKTGQTTLEIFSDVIERIKNAKNEDDLLDLGIDIQGRQLANLQNAINSGALSLENLNDGFELSNNLLEQTYQNSLTIEEQFKILGNEFLASLIEPAKLLMPVFMELMTNLQPIFKFLAERVGAILTTAFKIINPFLKILGVVFEIVEALEPFQKIALEIYESMGSLLVEFLKPIFQIVKMLAPVLVPVLIIFDLINKVLRTIIEGVKIIYYMLTFQWDKIGDGFKNIGKVWTDWDNIKNGSQNLLELGGYQTSNNLTNLTNINQQPISNQTPNQNEQTINTNLIVDGKILASTLAKVGGEKSGEMSNQRILRNW